MSSFLAGANHKLAPETPTGNGGAANPNKRSASEVSANNSQQSNAKQQKTMVQDAAKTMTQQKTAL